MYRFEHTLVVLHAVLVFAEMYYLNFHLVYIIWLWQDYINANSFISRRGPDVHDGVKYTLWSKVQALFVGFVLHLRGDLTPQPLTNDNGDLLLWNGEIFGGIEVIFVHAVLFL